MRKQFGTSQAAILAYIEAERLPHVEEWAGYCTRFLRNYGYITTSPNEASNGAIKGYGLSFKNGFVEVFVCVSSQLQGA